MSEYDPLVVQLYIITSGVRLAGNDILNIIIIHMVTISFYDMFSYFSSSSEASDNYLDQVYCCALHHFICIASCCGRNYQLCSTQ